MLRRALSLSLALTLIVTGPAVSAQYAASGPSTWTFDETTAGGNVSWVSPTSEDPSGSVYATTYSIDLVEVGISFLGIPFGSVDVTDQIPPEQTSGGGEFGGPAPITLLATSLVFPDPPAAPSVAADVSLGLNADGFGFFTAENVTLGQVEVDLGGIFGTVNADITSIRVAGSLSVQATWFDLGNDLAGTLLGAPALTPSGSLEGGSPGSLTISNALPSSTAYLVASLTRIDAPFKGGVLVPDADVILTLPVGVDGTLALPFVWPAGIPSRASLYLQAWVSDASGPAGFTATAGVQGLTP